MQVFCDLLERIWSHGLHHKPNGKSALWNHIKCYVKLNNYDSAQISHVGLPINFKKDENSALVWCIRRKQLVNHSVSASHSHTLEFTYILYISLTIFQNNYIEDNFVVFPYLSTTKKLLFVSDTILYIGLST